MEVRDMLKYVDHTLLAQTAVWSEIQTICDEAVEYGTASVCIPPCFVKQAKEYVGDRRKYCRHTVKSVVQGSSYPPTRNLGLLFL